MARAYKMDLSEDEIEMRFRNPFGHRQIFKNKEPHAPQPTPNQPTPPVVIDP